MRRGWAQLGVVPVQHLLGSTGLCCVATWCLSHHCEQPGALPLWPLLRPILHVAAPVGCQSWFRGFYHVAMQYNLVEPRGCCTGAVPCWVQPPHLGDGACACTPFMNDNTDVKALDKQHSHRFQKVVMLVKNVSSSLKNTCIYFSN